VLQPHPTTTRGEAEEIGSLARAHHWSSVLVVTSKYHISRARHSPSKHMVKAWAGALLADAAERACVAAQNVGAKFLVVDALHERAAAFYEHHGFTRIPETLRLLQKISAIAKALDGA